MPQAPNNYVGNAIIIINWIPDIKKNYDVFLNEEICNIDVDDNLLYIENFFNRGEPVLFTYMKEYDIYMCMEMKYFEQTCKFIRTCE